MTWFPKQLDWSRKYNGKGLQMPLGIPIATGVLALLALLALACHCIKEAWKSKWKPRWRRWRRPCSDLQLVSIHGPHEGHLGTPSAEPSASQVLSPVSP